MESNNREFNYPLMTKRPENVEFAVFKAYQRLNKKALKEYKKGDVFHKSLNIKQVYTSNGYLDVVAEGNTYTKNE